MAATITFTNQNDAPMLGNNSLTITEGATVVLTAADLSATDVDNADPSLIFTVCNVLNGQFELSGVPTTTFTQADVAAEQRDLRPRRLARPRPPTTSRSSDGALTTGPVAATITFTNQNDAPTLGNNSLTITEGATVVLTAADLSATDVDNTDPNLIFTVSNVLNGQFELSGVPTTTFTQADVAGEQRQLRPRRLRGRALLRRRGLRRRPHHRPGGGDDHLHQPERRSDCWATTA